MTPKPIVWTIAGADCSGGAGIAADIKTGHCLGVEVCHLITANTVQNSQQLISVNPTSIEVLQQQLNILKDDKPLTVIKVGLLATQAQCQWLISTINILKKENPTLTVLLDPVAVASVGGALSQLTVDDYRALLPYIDVLTPNVNEAQYLTASPVSDANLLARRLCYLGVKSAIIKGGHVQGDTVIDLAYCASQDALYRVSSSRIKTDYSHGGGCSFAMAIASFLSLGYLLRDALTLTKAFINQGLNEYRDNTGTYGAFEQPRTALVAKNFPKVVARLNENYAELPPFAAIESDRGEQALGLYPVVDSVAWLEKLLPLGINIIQLRLKNKTEQELDLLIERAVKLSQQFKTRLFINDHWQLAIKHGAYGVHIGQEDLLDADLSVINNTGLRLGISTHGCYEFLLAQQLQPSYLAIGAIFATKTKDMSGQIQGIENLKQLLKLANNIPIVAIGGINEARAESVWQTGVDAIAVVTAVTEADDYRRAVSNLQAILTT